MRRVVLFCLVLVMVLSTVYILKPKNTNSAAHSRVGYPIVSFSDVFRHH